MKILKVRSVKTPTRANSNDAGIDFFVPTDFYIKDGEDLTRVASSGYTLDPGLSILIPSGIKVNVPKGHALIAFNKSGVSVKKNIIVGACVIDESYQGEIHFDLKNVGYKPAHIQAGDKILQFILLPINYSQTEEVNSVEELYEGVVTARGEGGFGSTGTK
jgi:dUTP pyrophosphatase